jgi:4'-phosphopantetheinyl transferase
VDKTLVHIALARPGGSGAPRKIDDIAWTSVDVRGNDAGTAGDAPPSIDPVALRSEELQSFLGEQEAAECARLRHEEDRRTYAAAHGLARLAVGGRLCRPPREVEFTTGAFGKPRVAGMPGLHLSFSYRRGWVAVAVADAPVGIDLELTADPGGLPDIAQRWFHPDELAHLASRKGRAWTQEFFALWTRKEALLKAAGLGVDYMPQAAALKSRAFLLDDAGLPHEWLVQHFAPTRDIALALALADGAT